MKKILLKFLTEKGRRAYYSVEKEGEAQNIAQKKAVQAVAKDTVISENPLIVRVKVSRVARIAKVDIVNPIRKGLLKYGAEEGTDYTMEVS